MEETRFSPEIDAYIADAAPDAQAVMNRIRAIVHEEVPEVTEKISWGMATFSYCGNLIHFGKFAKHLGLYPGSGAVEHFLSAGRLGAYKSSKGGIQLPYGAQVDEKLVREILRFSANENRMIDAARKEARKEKRKLRASSDEAPKA